MMMMVVGMVLTFYDPQGKLKIYFAHDYSCGKNFEK